MVEDVVKEGDEKGLLTYIRVGRTEIIPLHSFLYTGNVFIILTCDRDLGFKLTYLYLVTQYEY